jgi:D-inositol-3-phosphate glycosyltransferase
MSSAAYPLTVWIIDPISYSGMVYSDVGQIVALSELGAQPLLVGSDSWMLQPGVVPRISVFRGTHGRRSRLRKGANYVASLARLLSRIRKYRPNIVHWQFMELPAADFVALKAIRWLGVPQVYTAHELLPWATSWYDRRLFSWIYNAVDAIIVHNTFQRDEMLRRFPVDALKVHVAALGDYSLFANPELRQSEARARLGLLDDSPVALFFGTIRPSKGLEVLLAAWAVVVSKMPDAILLIVGKPYKGLDPRTTVAMIQELGVEDTVRTRFEQVDPAETNTYYRAADVVVLPYHEIGTSGVLRYAYNSARPVIATAVGEHRAHVIDGKSGYLVPAANPGALADALLDSLRDRARLRVMGEAAQLYAAMTFRWLDSARDILRIYERLRNR